MIATPSNPFLATVPGAAAAAASAPRVEKPAETDTPPAGDTADDEEDDEEDDPPAEPVKPETPTAEPEAANAGQTSNATPRLTAFDRGALRLLGKGDLVARVERAESETARLIDANATLAAENQRLVAELNSLRQETPKKIEAAAKGRENEVAKGVAAELQSIGITPDAAPNAISAKDAEKSLTRAEFDALDHAARNEFMRKGGTIV